MSKSLLLTSLLAVSFAGSASATVSFLLQADKLKDQNGVTLPANSLFLIVASETDGAFAPILPGASLSVGSAIDGGDDIVLFRGSTGSNGTVNLGASSNFTATLTGNLSQGDPLEIVWFPGKTTASSTTVAGDHYGAYTSSTASPDGFQPWIMPADGTSSYLTGFMTTDGATFGPGSTAASAGNAVLQVVPEPGSAALGLIGLACFGMRRPRRRA